MKKGIIFAALASSLWGLLPLYLLGLLQYIAPTGQMLRGVFLWNEPFETAKIIGFTIIWSALVIYSAESAWFVISNKKNHKINYIKSCSARTSNFDPISL